MKHKHSGFTLIELVLVIVILGILAATAAPKFIDLSSDARSSTVEALAGSLKSGAKMVNAKAIIDGVTNLRGYQYDIDNDASTPPIYMHSGYPAVTNSCDRFVSGLDSWMDLHIDTSCEVSSDSDWFGYVAWNTFYFMPAGFDSDNDQCYVSYQEATGGSPSSSEDLDYIIVTIETDGC